MFFYRRIQSQLSSKKKVFSGFGLGVIASILLLSVLFLNHPLRESLLYPVFQWSSQLPTSSSSSSKDVGLVKNQTYHSSKDVGLVKNQTNQRTSPELSKTPTSLDSSGGKVVPEKPQTGNASSVEVTDKNNGGNGETHEEEVAGPPPRGSGVGDSVGEEEFNKCDIFDGRWVRDEGKPYYPAGSCPHIDKEEDCYRNGRPDSDFMKWRWQPNHCTIPSLNATDFLERLRGKRFVFVGDSLNRNMWQSLVCILRHSVADKKKVYEVTGQPKFNKKGIYAFHFEQFNCSIDFVPSPYLVRVSSAASGETLRLDLIDKTTSLYEDADVIVFNTGHWWTHPKTSKGENYYQEGNHVYPKLQVLEAYSRALTTWAKWVNDNVNVHKSQVFFRGYSVTHFRGSQWNSGGQCYNETEPIYDDKFLDKYPSKMRTLEHVLEQMKTPVVYLNISRLTDYRKDAHPSIYGKQYKTEAEKHAAESSGDCSHWCLPGVPDTWNELLYASLLREGRGVWRN